MPPPLKGQAGGSAEDARQGGIADRTAGAILAVAAGHRRTDRRSRISAPAAAEHPALDEAVPAQLSATTAQASAKVPVTDGRPGSQDSR